MFKVDQGSPRKLWIPIDRTAATTVLYEGQLVQMTSGSYNGVAPLAAASGAADTTGAQVIMGIVCGTNNMAPTEVYEATYGQYQTAVQSVAAQLARRNLGVEGMHPKGDPQPMVEIDVLTPSTVIRGDICNTTQGVAPSVVTATAVNATMGLGFTTGAVDVTTVANLCTFYCRTGANAGIYRVAKTAHATVHTFDTYWPYTLAIGDTFVCVPLRQGVSYARINATATHLGTCFSSAGSPATDYFSLNVLELDLREAGKETVLFMFNPIHYASAR